MEQTDTAICPECEEAMPITAEHNGVAWVGHGICPICGWASQHALPDNFKHNVDVDAPSGARSAE
jgi:hypothetical protein